MTLLKIQQMNKP